MEGLPALLMVARRHISLRYRTYATYSILELVSFHLSTEIFYHSSCEGSFKENVVVLL